MALKIGKQAGSLINHLHSRATIGQPQVTLGMGVTILHWSDRSPGTIFATFTKGVYTYIEIRADKYERIDSNGMSESQEYEYSINCKGSKTFYRRKTDDESASWESCYKNDNGRWIKGSGAVMVGRREKYHDFSF